MAKTIPPELANLPPPSVIEVPSHQARFLSLQQQAIAIFTAAGVPYDMAQLESDPLQVLLQTSAYQDIVLRTRINEAIKSWFLAYATGGDLDVLANWYDVYRLPGETDDALTSRVILAIQGRSPGGTEARYTFIARSADVRVASAKVYTVGRDPTINVAIFSTDNNGVAGPDLLAKVNAALQASTVRMVNDRIVVASAARQTINMEADYWLLPDAAESTEQIMRDSLAAAWTRDMLLGRNFVLTWAIAKLQVDGVQKIEMKLPAADIIIPSNQAAARGSLVLNLKGRDY